MPVPDPGTIGSVVLALLGLAMFLALLRPVWLPVWRAFRATQQFLEDWGGSPERPGHDRVPSIPERLATVEKRSRQLEPNGGAHIADAVWRTEAKTDEAAVHAREAATLAAEAARIAGQAAITVAQVHQKQLEHQPAADQRDADIARLAGDVEGMRVDIEDGRQREQVYLASLHELGIPLGERITRQDQQ